MKAEGLLYFHRCGVSFSEEVLVVSTLLDRSLAERRFSKKEKFQMNLEEDIVSIVYGNECIYGLPVCSSRRGAENRFEAIEMSSKLVRWMMVFER